jgi:hypothetical protein
VLIVLKSGSLNLLEPSGPVKACNGIAFTLPAVGVTLTLFPFPLMTGKAGPSSRNGKSLLDIYFILSFKYRLRFQSMNIKVTRNVKNQLDAAKYAVLLPQHVSGTNMAIIVLRQ